MDRVTEKQQEKDRYNSKILKLYLDYLQERYPGVDRVEILDYAGIAVHEVEDPNHWFSQRHIDRFHEILEKRVGNPDLAREVGRQAAVSSAIGPIKQYLLGFVNIASAYAQVEKLAANLTRAHSFTTKKTGNNSVAVMVRLKQGEIERSFQCDNRLGMLESVAELFTNKLASVEHPACIHRGDDRCEYIITWEKPRSRLWKQLRNITLTAGVLASITLYFPLPLATWLCVILGAVLVALLFSYLTSHQEKFELSETIRRQGNAAKDLIDEINKHYRDAMLVQEIGKKTSTVLNMYELIVTVVNAMERYLDYDYGMLLLSDKSRKRLIYASGYGYGGDIEYSLQKTKLYLSDTQSERLFLWVFQNQVPVIVNSFQEMERSFVEDDLNFASRLNAEAVICVPIMYEKRSLGVLAVWNTNRARRLKEGDRVLLMAVASQTASCINNALYLQKLSESEEKYRSLVESSYDGICIVQDGELKFINGQALEIVGYDMDEVIGAPFAKFIHPSQLELVREKYAKLMFGGERGQKYETSLILKSGERLEVEVHAYPTNFEGRRAALVFVRDITERKDLEKQLRHVQKMEAVGTLAGGIAHDFNNILTAIIGYLELALQESEEGTVLQSHLKEVLKASYRARDLVMQILAFSRQGDQETKPIQISHQVKEALKLLRSTLPSTIEITSNIAGQPGIILGDPTQIHQIVMNLCTNAAHAMDEEGGVLEVGVEDVFVDRGFSERHVDVATGPYVRISVRDTGKGMAPEVVERIFEPYFTTKEKGQGTGLGLATVHGIVNRYGGTIEVESTPGQGSLFQVFLPAVEAEESDDAIDSRVLPTGTEHILLVDDEEPIVRVGEIMFKRLGYRVTIRTSSVEALQLFKARPDDIDIVITDMTMPNMTGDRLAREILATRPDVPIILCTGFSEKINQEKAKQLGIRAFLMKPLVLQEIAHTVRSVLDGIDTH
jgi:PAS domain S-box-containing protein